MIKVFFCTPTSRVLRSLRRYANGPCKDGGEYSYHNANDALAMVENTNQVSGDLWPHDDPRWPKTCEKCGYKFADTDTWQVFYSTVYRRMDTGDLLPWSDMPVGAVRDCEWLHGKPQYCGPDGRSLECKTPGGSWIIDSVANNCTMPNDLVHKCWVRHGKPEDGTLHVDKNGHTCGAGAGSIVAGNFHGFLHNGHLTNC